MLVTEKEIKKIAPQTYAWGERTVYVRADQDTVEAVLELLNAPPVIQPKPKRRVGTFREFMALFTREEQLAVKQASIQNPEIGLWYDRAMGGPNFSLDHSETALGLQLLVSEKLIKKDRALEIAEADFDLL